MVSPTALREPPESASRKTAAHSQEAREKNNGLPANVPYMPTRGKGKTLQRTRVSSKARCPKSNLPKRAAQKASLHVV